MLRLIGLDLAWTLKNPTGICVVDIDGEDLTVRDFDARCLSAADAVALATERDGDTVVCIDAPLVLDEHRLAERALAVTYGGRRKAAPYTARRAFLEGFNGLAGPDLATALLARGFAHANLDPVIGPARWMLEVYPHACHVSLWSLDERIKYKKGKLEDRRIGMAIYQSHLRALLEPEWPGLLADDGIVAALDSSVLPTGGTALKDLEDRLDALTCVYTAFHAWTHGNAGLTVYGSPETGAIVVPKWPDGKSWLPL